VLSDDSLEKTIYLRNHGGASTNAVIGHDARLKIRRFGTLRIILRTHTDSKKDIYDATDAYGFQQVESTANLFREVCHELTSSLLDVAAVSRMFPHVGQAEGDALFLSAANPGLGHFVRGVYFGRARELDTSTTQLIPKDNGLANSCLLPRLITSRVNRFSSTATEQAVDTGQKAIGHDLATAAVP